MPRDTALVLLAIALVGNVLAMSWLLFRGRLGRRRTDHPRVRRVTGVPAPGREPVAAVAPVMTGPASRGTAAPARDHAPVPPPAAVEVMPVRAVIDALLADEPDGNDHADPDPRVPAGLTLVRPVEAGRAARASNGSATGRRGTRRFTLPPLDEDADRAARIIETFLTPDARPTSPTRHPVEARVASAGQAGAGHAGADHARAAATGPSSGDGGVPPAGAPTGDGATVIVALVGLDGHARATGDDVAERLSAHVGAVLRRLARTTDEVTVLDRGRYRVDLRNGASRSARMYLARVHAACGPWLVAAGIPVQVRSAIAGHGSPEEVTRAIRRVERRRAADLPAVAVTARVAGG